MTHAKKFSIPKNCKSCHCGATPWLEHNLYQTQPISQSKLGRDVELQNTHIVLFKSPRDVLQINTLGTQLGLGSQLKEWYQDATSVPYGHLLIDLSPKQLILYDIVQTVVQHQQSFIFQNIHKILLFWMMNTQYLYAKHVPSWTPKCRKLFLLHCPKDFIGFIANAS